MQTSITNNYDGCYERDGIQPVCLTPAPSRTTADNIIHRLGNSGLKISKVILGAMSYGTKQWQDWVLDQEEALPLIEHAYKRGINTWDTVR